MNKNALLTMNKNALLTAISALVTISAAEASGSDDNGVIGSAHAGNPDVTASGKEPSRPPLRHRSSFCGVQPSERENEPAPAITVRTAPIHEDASWLVSFPPGYDAFVATYDLRNWQEDVLDEYLNDPCNADIETLGLTRKNLLDLLCLHEFTRKPSELEAHALSQLPNDVKLLETPECVTWVTFKGCKINWIPVTELTYLFRNLKVVALNYVGEKIDLTDLLHLHNIRALLLDNLPITEFPYFLYRFRNLIGLMISNSRIEGIDFTDQEPFPALESLAVCGEIGVRLGYARGLLHGLPGLEVVCTVGADERVKWEAWVEAYLPERRVGVIDLLTRRPSAVRVE